MDRKAIFKNNIELKDLFNKINQTYDLLNTNFKQQFDRSLPFADTFFDRWERAQKLGFGKNTSVYDSVLVFGQPKIGKDVWIGPNSIIDGSGKLTIGDNVTISTGVHIYTHDNIKQTLLGKHIPIERGTVTIENNTYIGPNVVIAKDVVIKNHSIIATNSFVNKSFPSHSIIAGNPAKKIGAIIIDGNNLSFKYH